MAGRYTTETFVRGAPVQRVATTLPASLYNLWRRLLRRSRDHHLFLPLRDLQYLAVLQTDEALFVDGAGSYQLLGDRGGRPIVVAWRPASPGSRQSLTTPVACETLFYRHGLESTQRRLVLSTERALKQLEQRSRPQE